MTELNGDLFAYQRDDVERIAKMRRAIVCHDVGLGKTAIALAAIATLDAYPALVVCPSFAKATWRVEILRWLPDVESVVYHAGKTPPKASSRRAVHVVNYDLLSRSNGARDWLAELLSLSPLAFVADESQYLGRSSSNRTKACLRLARRAGRLRLCLTATPVANGPREFASQLAIVDRLGPFGGSQWNFLQRFCNPTPGQKSRYGYWDFSGANELPELNRLLREHVMLRRTKGEVQKELPERREVVLRVDVDNADEYAKAEKDFRSWARQRGVDVSVAEGLKRVETLRQLAVRGKMSAAFEWIDAFLASGRKLVVFATHVETLARLRAQYPWGLFVEGATSLSERESAIERFNDPASSFRLFAANIRAAGVNISLASASDVLFLEMAWTPAAHEQAEGRLHRHGQRNPVTAYYLVARSTIDETVRDVLAQKREVVDAAVDGLAPGGQRDLLAAILSTLDLAKSP